MHRAAPCRAAAPLAPTKAARSPAALRRSRSIWKKRSCACAKPRPWRRRGGSRPPRSGSHAHRVAARRALPARRHWHCARHRSWARLPRSSPVSTAASSSTRASGPNTRRFDPAHAASLVVEGARVGAAVQQQVLPGQVAGLLTAQEGADRTELGSRAKALGRDALAASFGKGVLAEPSSAPAARVLARRSVSKAPGSRLLIVTLRLANRGCRARPATKPVSPVRAPLTGPAHRSAP